MKDQQSTVIKVYSGFLATLGWFALISQLYINITSKVAPAFEIIIRYFSYFTLTTNLIVATCCTVLASTPNSNLGSFFAKQKTLTAIAVYIVIVGVIYNLVLRFIWNPKGLQMVVDEILHSVVPVLFFIYWIIFVPKKRMKWSDVLPWLIYPFVYVIFILVRGEFYGFYPYPFINTTQIGLKKVLINSSGIALVFMITSLLFIAISNIINKKSSGSK